MTINGFICLVNACICDGWNSEINDTFQKEQVEISRASLVAQLVKESTCDAGDRVWPPWVGKIPWKREQLPTLAFLSGESHGQRSLVGYSLWGCRESDTTERLSHTEVINGVTWLPHRVLSLWNHRGTGYIASISGQGYWNLSQVPAPSTSPEGKSDVAFLSWVPHLSWCLFSLSPKKE